MADQVGVVFEFDDSQAIKALENINQNLEKTDKIVTETVANVKGELIKMEKGFESGNKKIAESAAATNEAKQAASEYTKKIGEQVKSIKIFGVSIGDTIQRLKDKKAALIEAVSGVGNLAKAFGVLKVAAGILLGAIGVLIAILGALAVAYTKTQEGGEKFRVLMAQIGSVASVLTDRIGYLGKSVINIFTGDVLKSMENFKKAFTGIRQEIEADIEAAGRLERQLINLEKAEALINAQRGLAQSRIKELNLIAEDTTKSEKERAQAAREGIQLVKQDLQLRQQAVTERLKNLVGETTETGKLDKVLTLVNTKFSNITDGAKLADSVIKELGISESTVTDLQEFTDEVAKLGELRASALEAETTLNNKLNTINQEARNRAKAAAAEELQRLNELKQKLLEINKLNLDSQFGNPFEKLQKQKELSIKAVQELEAEIKKLAKSLGKDIDISEEVRQLFFDIDREFEQGVNSLAFGGQKLATDVKQKVDAIFNNFNFRGSIDEITKGIKDALIELEKEIPGISTNDAVLERLANFKENLKKEGKEFADLLKVGLTIPKATEDSLIDSLQRLGDKIKNALGLDDEQFQTVIQNTTNAIFSIQESLIGLSQSELDAQDGILEMIQNRISATEQALQTEIELAQLGFANNVDLKRKELEALRKEEEKAAAEREKLRQKVARQQLVADAAQQVSSLITAAADLTKGFSKFGPLALALIPLAIAGIFGIFARAKATAKQAVKLREGAKLKGKSHEQGGTPLMVEGQYYEAEKNEWLIGTKQSKEHDKFLAKLNAGKYSGIDIEKNVELALNLRRRGAGTKDLVINKINPKIDLKGLEAMQERTTTKIVNAILSKKSYVSLDEKQYLEIFEDKSGNKRIKVVNL